MKRIYTIFLLIISVLLLNSCNHKLKEHENSFVIVSINDVYRTQGVNNGKSGGLSRVRTLIKQLQDEGKETLVLHAGDFLQPSFSSRINYGASMISIMNQLDEGLDVFDENMIVTFGNHEFDKGKMKYMNRLQQRIDESEFTWLDSNINWLTGGISSSKIKKSVIKEIAGIKVGIFSLTTDMAHPEYIANFDNPLLVTKHYVPLLKSQGADFVIALTHQRMSDDEKLLKLDSQYRPDLIVGGHEHYRQLNEVNSKWIVKADADAVSAAVIEVHQNENAEITVMPTIIDLDDTISQDSRVEQSIQNWNQQTNVKYCQKLKKDADCLDFSYGKTLVDLVAEESEIRRFETNMGNFIADTARAAFKTCDVDVVAINSGSIRLNYNIPANSEIKRLHIEGIFAYPSNLKMIQITGKTLKQMLNHSISMWTANGHWLLVSGIRFVHNPETQQQSNLIWEKNQLEVKDDETLNIVVPQYLIDANTDHDGYDMISESDLTTCDKNGLSLKELIIKEVSAHAAGISPKLDGRICNTLRNDCGIEKLNDG
jgi:2',3'-cyclic-nucleotide 2'-phosphodiesterase (5'-nucleotidase family)